MRQKNRILAVVALGVLAGCSTPTLNKMPHETADFVYQCDNALPLRVTYDRTEDTAIVNDMMTLPLVESGSGFRYRSAEHELQGKGNEVIWIAGRAGPWRCVTAG